MRSLRMLAALVATAIPGDAVCRAAEPAAGAAPTTPRLSQARPTEPLRAAPSAAAAADALDQSALAWQQVHKCCQCHANLWYLPARPTLQFAKPEPPEVRRFFESIPLEKWPAVGLRYGEVKTSGPQPVGTEAIVIAFSLALHDRRTSGTLHSATRAALDRMLTVQNPAGDWSVVTDVPADCFGAFTQSMLAALAIAAAPDDYAAGDAAQNALRLIRTYVQSTPPQTRYQRAMLAWAGTQVDGLADAAARARIVDELRALQRDDGSWSFPELLADHEKRRFGTFAADRPGDALGTGFVTFVLRRNGVAAEDPQLRRAIDYLLRTQRASGRWFQESLVNRPLNVTSNAATAWAVMAVDACNAWNSPPAGNPTRP